MRDPDIQLIARAFRDIRKAIDDVARRSAASHLTGKVAMVDGNMVRLELLPADSRTGKPFLSPWVQVQDAAGATASHTPVAVGDPMRLLSPHGEIGPASLAVRDSHVQDRPNPANAPDEYVLVHAGCEIRLGSDGLTLKRGGISLTISDTGVRFAGGTIAHDGTDIGASHRHGGVDRGAAQTDTPSAI